MTLKLFSHYILAIFIFLFSCKSATKKNADGSLKHSDPEIDTFKFSPPTHLTTEEFNTYHAGIEAWYKANIASSNFNGAVLVAKDGNIIFERYKGAQPLNGTDSVDANMPFHIASVTKTFTAMSVLKLQEEGKLKITDYFSSYFPEFNFPDVTIFHLLTHRSGLPNYEYFLEHLNWDPAKPITNYEVLQFMVANHDKLKNVSPPGKHFAYCNTNYALLALLIEKVTGKTYPNYISETIFKPAGMKHSFVFTPVDSQRISKNYDWKGREEPLNYLDYVYGDKNIYSTVRDLYKWDRALTEGFLLHDTSLVAAYKPYSNERPGIKNYGLGWRMDVFPNGRKLIFHTGWWHGNTSSFVRLIDEKATVIALSNRFTRVTYSTKQVANLFSHYFDYTPPEDTHEEEKSDSTSVHSDTVKTKQKR